MVHRFDDVEIDEERREIRRAGIVRVVEPRVFDLIVHLARNRDRVVGKQELLDALWPDEDVFENALTVAVHRARRALEGGRQIDGGTPRIRTLSRRGYRFVHDSGDDSGEPRRSSAPASAPPPPADGLVGRAAERRLLREALRATLERRPRFVLFRGEPGIGKTRLLEEADRSAQASGFDVLWARGEGRSGASFSLWRQILAAYAARSPVAELEGRLGSAAGVLAPLLPAWPRDVGRMLDLDPDRSGNKEAVRDAIAKTVHVMASGPLLMLLDDVHDADADSLLVLEHVVAKATGIALLVVAAARDSWTTGDGAAPEWLAPLREGKRVLVHDVGGLSDDDVRLLIDDAAGTKVPEGVAATVLRRAAGNPLFASQYWRYLVSQRLVLRDGERWLTRVDDDAMDLPSSVRSVIRERCSTLSASARDVLALVALFGRDPSFAELAAASDLAPGELAEILDRALDGRVLRSGSEGERYRLSHPTFAQFLHDELPVEERRVRHRRIADALERLHGSEDQAHLRVLAHHASLGADAATSERAIELTQRLARAYSAKLDLSEAARWLQRSIRLIEVFRPDQKTRRFGLLFNLGEMYVRVGQEDAARRAFSDAAGVAASPAAADGGSGARPDVEPSPSTPDRLITVLRAGMDLLEDEPTTPSWEDESEEWHRTTQRGEARARRVDDMRQLASALVSRRWRASVESRPQEQMRLSTEAVLLAEHAGDPALLLEARLLWIHDLLEHGRIAEAEREADALVELASRLENPVYRWVAAFLPVTRAHVRGRLEEAEQLATRALQAADLSFADVAGAFMGSQLVGIRAYQGRMNEMVGLVEAFAASYPTQPIGHASVASVYCELGRVDEARIAFARAMEMIDHTGPFGAVVGRQVAAALARPCVRLGEPAAARLLYERLLPARGTFLVAFPAVSCIGPADAYLALLAESAGRWRTAYALFRSAIAACERSGNRAIEAHTRYELARALLARGTRERRQAHELLERAATIARELALDGLAGWIESLRQPARTADAVVERSD